MTVNRNDRCSRVQVTLIRRALQVGRSRRCASMEARPSLWRSPIDCFSPVGFAMTKVSIAMTCLADHELVKAKLASIAVSVKRFQSLAHGAKRQIVPRNIGFLKKFGLHGFMSWVELIA